MSTDTVIDGLTIDELAIPATLDEPGGDAFAEMADVRNAVETEILGHDDLRYTATELLPFYNDPFAPKRVFVARIGGRIVGRSVYERQPEAAATAAFLEVQVLAEARRKGVGTALLAAAESAASADGWRVFESWSSHLPPVSDDVLEPPTGFGRIDRDSPAVAFALANGYRMEQVERMSHIDLPAAPELLAAKRSDAEAHAVGYEVVQWVGRCPDEWLADMARLHQRMSTDAPSAGIEFAEEEWDEDRVRNLDDMHQAGGRVTITSAALHVESNTLVGFTDIAIPAEDHRPASQEDTLVLKDHRGHRLGMLLKIANIEQLGRVSPSTPRITTFNAEENRPMLDVNEAVGFVPTGYEAAWKKTV